MYVNVAYLSVNSRSIVVFNLGANSIVHTTLCSNVNASVQSTLNVVSITNTNATVHIALHTNVSAGVQTALYVVSIPNTNAIAHIALYTNVSASVQTTLHGNVASLSANACTIAATPFSSMIIDLLMVKIGPIRTRQFVQERIAELHPTLMLVPNIITVTSWVSIIRSTSTL